MQCEKCGTEGLELTGSDYNIKSLKFLKCNECGYFNENPEDN